MRCRIRKLFLLPGVDGGKDIDYFAMRKTHLARRYPMNFDDTYPDKSAVNLSALCVRRLKQRLLQKLM